MRIVVIGGVAAGTKAAAKARREDANAEIEVYSNEEYISYAGCGQPYYIGGEIDQKEELLARTPQQFEESSNIRVFTRREARRLDPKSKIVEVTDLDTGETKTVSFEALVLATGAAPIVPKIPGADLSGVFQIRTIPAAVAIRERIEAGKVKQAVVVGGGYIGLEMAENLVEQAVSVTLVERLPHLAPIFDQEVSEQIKKTLEANGVRVLTRSTLEEISGTPETGVTSVKVNGVSIPADLVVLSVGVRPEVQLAQSAGIQLGPTGAIQVNERMQTNFPYIYAGGDCAETTHLVHGKPVWVPLGSTANKQGRVIGINITGGSATFPGVLATSIFRVFDLHVAKTGLTEQECKEAGFDYEAAIVPGGDKPHYMPQSKTVVIKLIAERSSRRVLGAEVWGQGSVDKSIDTLAAAIHFKSTVEDLMNIDLAYAPPYAPALGNVIVAAHVLQNKLDRRTEGVLPMDVKRKADRGDDFIFIDVRPEEGRTAVCFDTCMNIPLTKLASQCGQLPKDKEIIASCQIGRAAAQAYRILKRHGFEQVRYMDGGITTWPDPKPISKQE